MRIYSPFIPPLIKLFASLGLIAKKIPNKYAKNKSLKLASLLASQINNLDSEVRAKLSLSHHTTVMMHRLKINSQPK